MTNHDQIAAGKGIRRRRTGPYCKTNAYSHTASLQQIGTICLFALQLIAHSIFIVPALDDIRIQLLWILLGFHYTLLLAIAYDYVYLTVKDPVDKLVINQQLCLKYTSEDIQFCTLCNTQVRKTSHHCMRCDRCTEQFDHHCARNYQSFFRLLAIYTTYNINLIGQTVWVLIKNMEDSSIAFKGNQWGLIALLVLTVVIEIMVGALMVFHCYISCYQETTTFDHLYPENRPKDDPIKLMSIKLWGAPVSDERLGRQEGKVLY